jgi:cellulose synthase/poly-beta-1,6-N-acetylglucosamine synthase-like glycosyltransferase
MHFVLCTSYFAVLLVLAMYGLHRSHLVLTVLRHRKALEALKEGVPALPSAGIGDRDDLPHVTIQLPLYNEATVADRLLDHVAAIEWPASRLEIQVLDDSTASGGSTSCTSTASIARATRPAPSTTA